MTIQREPSHVLDHSLDCFSVGIMPSSPRVALQNLLRVSERKRASYLWSLTLFNRSENEFFEKTWIEPRRNPCPVQNAIRIPKL